ncbi:MAG TPA: response regulator [Acidobacteriota bacterium]|jgi:CheY-like chemotaxis protein
MGGTVQAVLIVEDDDNSRLALRAVVEAGQYRVIEASDGESAVKMAVDCQPAIILMDLNLPRLNGIEATRQIRANPDLRSIPIIAITGMDEETCARASRAGCSEVLTKPCDTELVLTLLRWLAPDPGSSSGPRRRTQPPL